MSEGLREIVFESGRTLRCEVNLVARPLKKPFISAHGTRKKIVSIVVKIVDGNGLEGRGECVAFPGYSQNTDVEIRVIHKVLPQLSCLERKSDLMKMLPPSPARNAIDTALWDLSLKKERMKERENNPNKHAKKGTGSISSLISVSSDNDISEILKFSQPQAVKLKVRNVEDFSRLQLLRTELPSSLIVVDANGSLTVEDFYSVFGLLEEAQVEFVEQPVHPKHDALLKGISCPVPICADESFHFMNDDGIKLLLQSYDIVNLKLNKCGGLTAAIELSDRASSLGAQVFVGCLISSSLAIAPAHYLANLLNADFADLDGFTYLNKDCPNGLELKHGRIDPPSSILWG